MSSTRPSAPWSRGKKVARLVIAIVGFIAVIVVCGQTSRWVLDRLITDERSGRMVAAVLIAVLASAGTAASIVRWRRVDLAERRALKLLFVTVTLLTILPMTAFPGRASSQAARRAFDRRYPGFSTVYVAGLAVLMVTFYAVHRLAARRDQREMFTLWPIGDAQNRLDDPADDAVHTSLAQATTAARRLMARHPEVAAVDVAWDLGRHHWPVRRVTPDGVEDIDPAQLVASPRQRRRIEAARQRWVSSGSHPADRRRRRWRRR